MVFGYWVSPIYSNAELDPPVRVVDYAYCEGDQPSSHWSAVPQRPSPNHKWNGQQWMLDAALDAAAQRRATDITEQELVKADNQVQQFLNFTPAQLDAWVANNIEAAGLTLSQVKTNTGTALKVLGRIALAAGRGRPLR